jgi:hypothetical protein
MPIFIGEKGDMCAACMCCIPAGNIIGMYKPPPPIDIICGKIYETILCYNG